MVKKNQLLYIIVSIILLGCFIFVLYKPIAAMFFEADLIWAFPNQFHILTHNSFLKSISIFLFDVSRMNYLDPITNIYYYLIFSVFSPQSKYFVFGGIMLNLSISLLLFLIVRRSGLDFRTSFLAAIAYLSLSIYFHAYMWGMTSHHLFVIFFCLLIFYLYMITNQEYAEGKRRKIYYILTLASAFISSFCAVTILILPMIILVHMLFCSDSNNERLKKYERWLPLFTIYLGYPLLRMLYVGQDYVNKFLYFRFFQDRSSSIFMSYPVAFLMGIACLLLFRFVIKAQRYVMVKRLAALLFFLAGVMIFLYILKLQLTRDVSLSTLKRSFISPYNLIAPFAASMDFFLAPLKNIFTIRSASAYHFIPLKFSLSGTFISLGLLAVFFKRIFIRHKDLIIFVVIYLVTLRFLWSRTECPSRHMAYTSFLFCIAFTSSVSYIYDLVMARTRLRPFGKDAVLVLLFLFFWILNIFAIRVELFRGKLANTIFTYDCIKTANALKGEIVKSGKIDPINIYINNAPLVLLTGDFYSGSYYADPKEHYNLRFALAQALNDRKAMKINIDQRPNDNIRTRVYYIDHERIRDERGVSVEPFFNLFDSAVESFRRGQPDTALKLFKEAGTTRPFFLNYVLGSFGLKDSIWITGGTAIREWVKTVADNQEISKYASNRPILKIINKELDEYVKCLFTIAYLEYDKGNIEESRNWFRQLQYLEADREELLAGIEELPVFISETKKAIFFKEMIAIFNSTDISKKHRTEDRFRFILNILANHDMIKP